MNGIFARKSERLATGRSHLRLTNPAVLVERGREAVLSLAARGEHAMQRQLERWGESAAYCSGKLQSLSPLLTLSRGFSIVQRLPGMTLVRDGSDLARGDRIDITFQRGGARCIVESSRAEGDEAL